MNNPNLLFEQARGAYQAGRYGEAIKLLSRLSSKLGDHPDLLHLTGLALAKNGMAGAADDAFARAAALAPGNVNLFGDWAEIHSRSGDFAAAEHVLRTGITRNPTNRHLLAKLGFLKRDSGDRDGAALVFDHMLKSHPSDLPVLHARALVEQEKGGDSWPFFRRALQLSRDKQLLLGAATSLATNGATDEAISLVEQELGAGAVWPEGLQLLARLRWERGDKDAYTDGYIREIARNPEDVSLWAAFLGVLASSLEYERVLLNLPEARQRAGGHTIFDMMEAQALSETGRHEAAEAIFLALDPISDPTFVPIRLRSLLRTGRAGEAAGLGEKFTGSAGGNSIWPLLGIAWRILGDERWFWLERYEDTVSSIDLPLSNIALEETAQAVAALHGAGEQPYDQSVRGGTQTTGNLFERTEPVIARLRSAVMQAVEEYIGKLPRFERAHPFLGRSRGRFRFAGSWSIRLKAKGHHVSHVHPMGWISSALYLRVPTCCSDADQQAGYLALGQPPPELGLGLPAVRLIAPKPGRLVLFPSTMWHGTIPFPAGERLTAAFDVVPLEP
jgi:Flp pilus assembly protein TadD